MYVLFYSLQEQDENFDQQELIVPNAVLSQQEQPKKNGIKKRAVVGTVVDTVVDIVVFLFNCSNDSNRNTTTTVVDILFVVAVVSGRGRCFTAATLSRRIFVNNLLKIFVLAPWRFH